MKTTALLLLTALCVHAQETKKESAPADPSKPPATAKAAESAPPASAVTPEMEAKFKAALTNAVMDGRFCTVANGKLGPDKEDKYTIEGVEKTADSQWTIKAKIEYGAVSFTAPVPVQVKWAGDTPVIIVDNIGFPGTPKYSARVMIYGDTYSGTWSAGDHGGLMHGVLKKAEERKPEEKKQP
jgi:hypothetical protein